MKVEIQRHGAVTVVVPQDALTEATTESLQATLAREGLLNSVRLVLDLGQTPYVDSAGIEFLLGFCGSPTLQPTARKDGPSRTAAASTGPAASAGGAAPAGSGATPAEGAGGRPREALASGVRPRLAGLTDAVREALYLTDTLKRFSIFDSVPSAVRSYV